MTHGPVVGGVTQSSARVFVRTDQSTTVILRYGTDPLLETYTTVAAVTDVGTDFTNIFGISGLLPETTYYLNVVVNGTPQFSAPPYPTFTTFPAPGVARSFNFVVLTDFVTVQKLTTNHETFASAAAEHPAFVFIGGDFDHRAPVTLDDKRTMFKELYDPGTPFMRDFVNLILRQSPIVHQWDDHDAGLNNLDKTYPDWGLTEEAYTEYVPTYPLPGIVPGCWQQFSYAQVDSFVLDCRSQRDPETDPDDVNKSMLDGNNLGATGQLAWLENSLLNSTATWKVIFTSVITNTSTKVPDAWGGYQTEWLSLKNFINSNNIKNVVFISGDLHLSAIDNGIQAGFPEMCVSQPNADRVGKCATASNGKWSEGYYDDTCAGYGIVTVQQNPDRLTLATADEDGNVKLSLTLVGAAGPPVIMRQPVNQSVTLGEMATFKVRAVGNGPLRYQWRKNDQNILGATKAMYLTPPTTQSDNGSFFSVVVTDAAGSVTSNEARLRVKPPQS